MTVIIHLLKWEKWKGQECSESGRQTLGKKKKKNRKKPSDDSKDAMLAR